VKHYLGERVRSRQYERRKLLKADVGEYVNFSHCPHTSRSNSFGRVRLNLMFSYSVVILVHSVAFGESGVACGFAFAAHSSGNPVLHATLAFGRMRRSIEHAALQTSNSGSV